MMTDEEKGEKAPEIVLKVHIHCEGCASKLARFLKRFEGVEDVIIDLKNSKVVVKGKVEDPIKLSQSLQKKCGKNVELLSPAPKPSHESDEPHFPEPPKEEIKKQVRKDEAQAPPPPAEVITVALKIQMHCEACAQALRKRIRKIQGVETVETKLGSSEVVVKGVIEPEKLVEDIYKKTRKQASVIVKKEGEDKKEGIREEENKEMKSETKPNQYWPSMNYSEYANYNYPPPPHFFSDENPNACALM